MMGKEQELLDAARSGNIAVVEKILSHRVKKSGPLASLRRCPGPNTTDSCGYTCLHHAALNGHKDIVELLLTHDANPNIVDNKGSTALHLAAWTGDYEIVNMLLTQSSHVPNVNLKNNDFETALHCAAQYGHTSVVSLLLQKGSDPMCRNVKDESALDLAAQYGRTDTVELILRTRPSLVRHLTAKHSPLHLASRNGHKNVVKLLIDAKFDVNYCTETGSALHEAALFGKIEVVKLLLNSGVDIELEDYQKRTVLDLLNDLNTIIAKQTKKLIREHSTLVNTDLDDSSTLMSDSSSHCISPPPGYTDNTPEHHYNDQTLTDGIASPAMTSASEFSFYEAPPPPRLSIRSSTGSEDYKPSKARLSRSRDSILDGYSTSSSRSPSYLDYELPPPLPPRHFSNRDSQISESNSNNLYEIPPIPIAINCNDDYGSLRRNVINYELEIRPESQSSLCSSNSGYGRIGEKPIPPAKPPRKSISPVNRSYNCNNYDYNHQTGNENTLKTTKNDRNCDKSSANKSHTSEHTLNPFSTFKGDSRRRLIEESDFSLLYDQIANGSAVNSSSLNRPTFRAPHLTSHTRSKSEHQPLFFVDISDNLNSSSTKPNYSNSNSNLLKKTKRATVQIPINSDSNNHYNGQRTPDYEPPSPTTAANGIQAIINPLCLEYKRLSSKPSRDIETLTEEELFATLDSSGYVRLSFRKPVNDNNKVIKKSVAVSTDNQIPVVVNNNSAKNKKNIFNNYCETLKLDRSGEKENPFAGLCRGSVVSNIPSVKRRDITDGRKSLRRQRNFNCDNNIYSTLKRNKNKKSKSMDSSDKSRTRNVKNASVDDCLGVGNHKSGHEERKSDNISLLSGSPFDENAEWAEIANIMASFGSGIGRESLFNSEMENSFTSCLSKDSSSTDFEDQTVEEWLTRIGLSEYANLLIVNGFDNILYMGSNVMDDSDLLEIGVTNASHRDKMLLEAKTLPKVKLLTKSDEVLTVEEWLESLKLTEYRNSFRSNGYNEMSRVRNLWEVELNTVLEINKLGHRKRILASLGERLRLIEDLGLDDLDFDKLNLNISQLSVEEVLDNSMKTIDNKEEEPKIQRNSMTNPQLASDMDKIQTNQSSTQWKHTNKELIDSSCKYTANYLGSTLVRELRGIDSTRASIQKLKSSTKDIAKIPKIILSISYTGVQFIDAQTQQLVCEHEIRNIHCICQDSEDLNHFAYITKELETNNNYCHVFSAQNTDLVTEVILTLGQAFEIAYQMVLESDKCPKDMNVTNANINTSNNVDKSQSHNSINFNNPQNNNNNNSNNNNNNNNNSIKTNINNNTEITNKKDDNKENVKSTYITTINITTTDQKINSKVNEKVCQISSQTGQSSSNSVTNEEPKSSKPSTITTTTTISTKPIPPSGKPSPPVTTKSGQRPTPSPKPSTIPKPVTRTKPVLPFKPQILAKPTTK